MSLKVITSRHDPNLVQCLRFALRHRHDPISGPLWRDMARADLRELRVARADREGNHHER